MNNASKIVTIAKRTLAIEADTIHSLSKHIDESFVESVNTIFGRKGRVIVTGIGKSAIIAQKIVATLNSTGTPAMFMHAADAIHGDLGMIQQEDTVLCLSKSGATAEIKILIPLLKNIQVPLIGMVSTKNSYLARHADHVIFLPVKKEADPNNLAPTASTTAQLAMGDAIATALLSLRGFTPRDFAQVHPGGVLGKQLYLRVKDLYTDNEKPHVREEATLREVIVEMTSKRLGVTAVVNGEQQLLGIITDGDLRRMLNGENDLSNLRATDIMTRSPKTVRPDTLAVEALTMLRTYSITQVLVAEEKAYLGVIHLHDLLREGLV